MHWLDLYWLAMPEFSEPGVVPFHGLDALVFFGMGGLYVAEVLRRLRGASLLPVKDPSLPESLAFENV